MATKVWIDQDLCTGDGQCEEIAPAVFVLHDDGRSYVKQGDTILNNPGGASELAVVPDHLCSSVEDAVKECPGECIYLVED